MNRMLTVGALFLPLALAACPPPDTGERHIETVPAPPAPGPADPAMEQTAACTNPEAGYRIEYPAEWHTNPGDVMPECSLFDPEVIQIEPATELPFDIAVAIRREDVGFERVTGEQPGRRELTRTERQVDGRRAVRMETELTEDLLRPAGSRSYRYYIDRNGETLIAETHDVGELGFERKQRILDGMVETLRFTGAP